MINRNNEKNKEQNNNHNSERSLMTAILSLSLLTVMAGAAVAPALGTIREHFAGSGDTVIQLIISMPALFIFLTSFIFPILCRKFGAKTIVMIGLFLYVFGGCGAGFIDNISIVLVFRALVGCGVGLIMPMSTGLLTYYFPPEETDKLMGLSSAMNQMGGAVATFIAGLLATISWRAAFMVYLMGVISVVLCALFMPNDHIGGSRQSTDPNKADGKEAAEPKSIRNSDSSDGKTGNLRKFGVYVAAMFVLMSIFFIYPSNFALETASAGIMSQEAIATVMALMDVVAFAGGLCFVTIKGSLKGRAHYVAPLLFLAGYTLLAVSHSVIITVIGSFLIGFANGAGIPCIIAAASRKAGRDAGTTVMPMLSAAMYLSQFASPLIMSVVTFVLGRTGLVHVPFWFAAVLAVIFILIGAKLSRSETKADEQKRQALKQEA